MRDVVVVSVTKRIISQSTLQTISLHGDDVEHAMICYLSKLLTIHPIIVILIAKKVLHYQLRSLRFMYIRGTEGERNKTIQI